MKASLELADRRRGFQVDAWQVRPTDAFQRSGFQESSWQEDPHSGGFQDEAFQDESFQVTEDAFQEFAWQGSAFQIELEPAPTAVAEPARQPLVRSRQKSDRYFRVRKHQQARIARAPLVSPPPNTRTLVRNVSVSRRRFYRVRQHRQAKIASGLRYPATPTPLVKPTVVLGKRSRTTLVAKLRHDQAKILRAPVPAVVSFVRAVVLVHEDRRTAVVARRRRKPLILRSRVQDSPRSRVQIHQRSRNLKRRRRVILLRAPVAAPPPKNRVTVHERLRSRLRRRRPIILRGVSIPTPPPITGIPIKRVFVYTDRRAALVKAKRRSRQILRAPSVPTAVPWIRNHVYAAHRARNPLVARARRKPKLLRSFVAPVRPPLQLVHKQRRRLQQKRRRAIVIRSAPLWQRPKTPLVVGQHRKAGILARARHRLRLVVSRNLGPPPPPSTASAFGGVFLSDLSLYELGLLDLSLYELSLKDGELYAVSLGDLVNYDTALNDAAVYETSLSDIPGG